MVMPYNYPSDYMPDHSWVDDRDEVWAFGRVLIDLGVFVDANDAWAYYEKPWKWDRAYKHWKSMGSPVEGDRLQQFHDEVVERYGF